MKDILRFATTLALVTLISAGSLAWINKITRPKILAQREKEFNDGLFTVLPGIQEGLVIPIEENDEIFYYEGYRDTNKTDFIGYAFLAQPRGYSSTIETLVGVDSAGTILGIKILSQRETPGLGTRCEETRSGENVPWWQVQFSGKKAEEIEIDKDGGQIESITGATITSRAITDCIAERANSIFRKINNLLQE